MRKILRASVVGLFVTALVASGAGIASASEGVATDPQGAASDVAVDDASPSIFLSASDYTYAEVQAAVQDSPYVTVVPVTEPATQDGRLRGVTFGWAIYVRLSQTQARALLAVDLVGAAAIIGIATGGVGTVIASIVYAYLGSLDSDGLNRCARWQFNFTYTGKLSKASCY